MVDFFRGIVCQENDGVKMPGTGEQRECSFVNDVRPEKAKEFCLWRIDFSDGGRA